MTCHFLKLGFLTQFHPGLLGALIFHFFQHWHLGSWGPEGLPLFYIWDFGALKAPLSSTFGHLGPLRVLLVLQIFYRYAPHIFQIFSRYVAYTFRMFPSYFLDIFQICFKFFRWFPDSFNIVLTHFQTFSGDFLDKFMIISRYAAHMFQVCSGYFPDIFQRFSK